MDALRVQKSIAKEVLEELEVLDPYCILAGGAPRDWFFGKLASDLDFYVYDSFGYSQGIWMERLNKTPLDVKPLGAIEGKSGEVLDSEYASLTNLRYVFEGEYMGQTIQVMIMSEPTFISVLEHFCYGTSKAWWKGGSVNVTDEFVVEHSHKLFVSDKPVKEAYRKKMAKKFPDYKFVESVGEWAYPLHSSKTEFIKDWLNTHSVKGVTVPWSYW